MSLTFLLLIQAGAEAPLPPANPSGRDWESKLKLPNRCASDDPNEILVCGSRSDSLRYRLPPVADFKTGPVRAERELMQGVTGDVHLESSTLPNGMISKRVMVRTKIKF